VIAASPADHPIGDAAGTTIRGSVRRDGQATVAS